MSAFQPLSARSKPMTHNVVDLDKQYMSAMRRVWDDVEKNFDPIAILLPDGYRLVSISVSKRRARRYQNVT